MQKSEIFVPNQEIVITLITLYTLLINKYLINMHIL